MLRSVIKSFVIKRMSRSTIRDGANYDVHEKTVCDTH